MAFFDYRQNNSGGSFITDEARGIGCLVIIEADNAVEADYKAEMLGVYFDGDGDCPTCGDRWTSAQGWYGDTPTGDPVPSYYGTPVKDVGESYWGARGAYDTFIHYKDGRVEKMRALGRV